MTSDVAAFALFLILYAALWLWISRRVIALQENASDEAENDGDGVQSDEDLAPQEETQAQHDVGPLALADIESTPPDESPAPPEIASAELVEPSLHATAPGLSGAEREQRSLDLTAGSHPDLDAITHRHIEPTHTSLPDSPPHEDTQTMEKTSYEFANWMDECARDAGDTRLTPEAPLPVAHDRASASTLAGEPELASSSAAMTSAPAHDVAPVPAIVSQATSSSTQACSANRSSATSVEPAAQAWTEMLHDLSALGDTRRRHIEELDAWRMICLDLERRHESRVQALSQTLQQHGADFARLAQAEAALREMRTQAETKERASAAEIWRLTSRVSELEPFVKKAGEWEACCQTIESAKNAEIHALQFRLTELEAFSFEARALRGKVESLERQAGERTAEIEALKRDRATAIDQLAASSKEIEKLRDHLGRTQQAARTANEQLEAKEQRHAQEISGIMHDLEQRSRLVQELEAARADHERVMSALQTELENRELRIQSLSARGAESEFRLHEASESLKARDARIAELTSEIESLRRTSETQSATALEQASLCSAAQSVLSELRPKLEALEAQLTRRAPR